MRSATAHQIRARRLVAAAALTMAAVTPVAAGAPQVVGERHFEVVRDIPGFIDCGDYLIDYHVEVYRTITEYYDTDGNLVRAHFDIHYKGTLTNTDERPGRARRRQPHVHRRLRGQDQRRWSVARITSRCPATGSCSARPVGS